MKKVLLVMLALLVFLSCGNKNNTSGKTFVLNVGEEPHSIDPQITTDIVGTAVLNIAMEGLLNTTPEGTPVAGLAEKWEKNEEGTVWTFHLRDGLKWSNGDVLTANDFKAAWLRALNPKSASEYAFMLYPIKNAEEYNTGKAKPEDVGIKVVDDKTLEVTLAKPTAYFDDLVTFKTYLPLNEKFYKEVGDKYFTSEDTAISSGPYVLKKWVHDSEMVFEKNPNYWNKDNVKVDKIVYKLIADNSAALQAFKNGEVDFTNITVEQAKEYKGDKRLVSGNDGSVWYLLMNNKNKILSNSKVRKAIEMGIDRETLVNTVLNGNATVARTLVPEGIGLKGLEKDFTKEVPTNSPAFNPTEAKKLLAEGMKEVGVTTLPSFEMIFNDSGNNKVVSEYIQAQLRENLGIDLQLSALTFQERVSRMKQRDFDFVMAGWAGDFHDPITYLDILVTESGVNYASYSNPEYDRLVKLIKSTADPKVRVPAMIQLEKIISEDTPFGLLFHRRKQYLSNPKVKGVKITGIGGEFNLKDLDIEK